jgi:hypothetical protein
MFCRQTEDLTLSTPEPNTTMNNQQPNQQPNQIPGYSYPPQYYNYQFPYNAMSPYPPSAYPVATNMPMPNYSYYTPPVAVPHEPPPVYVPGNPPMYAPTMHYSQTRMATPTPYAGYSATNAPTPTYNYNTTNMISRPPRPASLYPQLNQVHAYPPLSTNPPQNQNLCNNNNNVSAVAKNESNRDSVENFQSRKSSEISVAVSVLRFSINILLPVYIVYLL